MRVTWMGRNIQDMGMVRGWRKHGERQDQPISSPGEVNVRDLWIKVPPCGEQTGSKNMDFSKNEKEQQGSVLASNFSFPYNTLFSLLHFWNYISPSTSATMSRKAPLIAWLISSPPTYHPHLFANTSDPCHNLSVIGNCLCLSCGEKISTPLGKEQYLWKFFTPHISQHGVFHTESH